MSGPSVSRPEVEIKGLNLGSASALGSMIEDRVVSRLKARPMASKGRLRSSSSSFGKPLPKAPAISSDELGRAAGSSDSN